MIKVAKAIILENNTVLLLKRSSYSEFFPNLCDIPGGKIKDDENLLDALHREINEETQLSIVPENNFCEYHFTEKETQIHFNVFKIKSFSGKIELSIDHTEFKWISLDDLNQYDLAPIVKLVFNGTIA